jgi:hypothetical protein
VTARIRTAPLLQGLILPHAFGLILQNLIDDPAPLSRQSYLLDQLAARQFGIAGPTLVEPRDGYKQTSSQVGQCGGGDKGQRLTASVGADC